MKSKKVLLLFSVIIFFSFLFIFISKKGTFSATDSFTGTRSDMQSLVLSTALSYYNKRVYTDYEQYAMDAHSTFLWRNFNNEPEMVSRSNYVNYDCSSFVSNVYLYSLGWDYSDYYEDITQVAYYDTNDVYKRNRDSVLDYQNMMHITGKGQGTSVSPLIKSVIGDNHTNGWNNDSNSEFVLYYETKLRDSSGTIDESDEEDENNDEVELSGGCNTSHYTETCEEQAQIRKDILETLQPGDMISYRRKSLVDGKIRGHIMLYVGNLFDKTMSNTGDNANGGFIHSTGKDYTIADDGTVSNIGEDTYTVRYDLWKDNIEKNIFVNSDTTESFSFAIIRPINKFCDGDTCTLNTSNIRSIRYKNDMDYYFGNTVSRNYFKNLKLEEHEFRGSNSAEVLNKYNSVNVGDTIGYRLIVTNMSTFKYCSLGKYTNEDCESKGATLLTANKATTNTYSNINISGPVPENTDYVDCSAKLYIVGVGTSTLQGVSCSYDASTRMVNFSPVTFPSGASSATVSLPDGCTLGEDCQYVFTYRVSPKSNGVINNPGMTVASQNRTYAVTVGKSTVTVNSTINTTADKSEFSSIVQNIKEENKDYGSNSGLKFLKDVYNQFFDIDLSEFSSYRTIIDALVYDKLAANSGTLSKYYRRIDYSNATETEKRINQMLVPGEYGGRELRGNIGGDRAAILFKEGRRTTLEVGDVIMAFKSNDEYKKTFTSQYVFIFTGYDSNNNPEFVRAYYTTNAGKTLYTTYSTESAKSGYQLFKEIYSYDLFFMFRPTRLYDYKSTDIDSSEIAVSNGLRKGVSNLTIGGITETSSMQNVLNKITFAGNKAITDTLGNNITSRNYVITGDKIEFTRGDTSVTYTLLVSGDVNSDGYSNKLDASILAKYIIDNTSDISELYLLAGDMNYDDDIKINDVLKVLQ